jgi:uncharacterized membrane-anchored protein YhcB (DUF1043 family)
MEEMSFDWLTNGIFFLGGAVLGALLTLWLQPSNQKSRQLEKQLKENEHKQTTYQNQVSEHFSETAELFSELTEKYKKVYDHLSKGSQSLCSEDLITEQLKLNDLQQTAPAEKNHDTESNDDASFSMPRDYADATEKGQQGGTLSEDFGLQKKRDTPIDS